MSSSGTKYYDVRPGDGDDSENDSFESALCELYNDVLFHAIIPEEEEFYFSCTKVRGGDSEDQTLSPTLKRERFLTANRESFMSLRSAAHTVGSSFMLSVGEDQTYDDDLSYMTENDFGEERLVSVRFEDTSECNQDLQIRCTQVPWPDEDERSSNFEERMVSVKFEDTDNCDQKVQLQCSRVPGEEEYNRKHKSRSPKMFSREGRGSRDTLNMSEDLDERMITRSTTVPTLECSDVSSQNASLSSMSCGSY